MHSSRPASGTSCPKRAGTNGEKWGEKWGQANSSSPLSADVDSQGNVWICDLYKERVRIVDPSGDIRTAVEDDVADQTNNRRRRGGAAGETVFAEAGIGYVMSETDRHERTVDLETGVTLLTFGYDAEDRLLSLTDNLGRTTRINRSGGVPVSIESPDGIVTSLTVDGNNQLVRVTYPDNTHWDLGYQNGDGLLTAVTQPNGNRFDTVYDPDTGRAESISDLAGGGVTFSRVFEPTGDVTRTVSNSENKITKWGQTNY